ncbi:MULTISPECIES: SAV_915 family protein [unclassified Streptomyces]|uniref:SAV_915 family protein n=1 Tax=unclassified Streptomyces TaxID=2593676 RepID=UPI001EF23555|nr:MULTISPECIES: SAV_915 family protein [unclassified Streptomyces]
MVEHQYAEDPEPSERIPAGPLLVPVRPGSAGCTARFFRTPLGGRTAVAFTTEQRLVAALGAGQEWIRLSASALHELGAPLGVTALTVDPSLVAPAPRPVGTTAHLGTTAPVRTAGPVKAAGPVRSVATPATVAAAGTFR